MRFNSVPNGHELPDYMGLHGSEGHVAPFLVASWDVGMEDMLRLGMCGAMSRVVSRYWLCFWAWIRPGQTSLPS